MDNSITDIYNLQANTLVKAICKEYELVDATFETSIFEFSMREIVESAIKDKSKLSDHRRHQFCAIAHTLMHAPTEYLAQLFKVNETTIIEYLKDFKTNYQTNQEFAASTDRIAAYYMQTTNDDLQQVIHSYFQLKEKGRLYIQESQRLLGLLKLSDDEVIIQEVEHIKER